ncbi:alpha/beta hydrolase [Pseudokineococcus sp. 5B2Z-1]|uniref:alpha/beta fold hydrolase n=1 Tax=Pseudokineococcus sp. 5B2Z-1 TaxID=3132744 RepID=UPI0030ACBBC5
MRSTERRVEVTGGHLGLQELGDPAGDAVLVVPTALVADELLPLARRLADAGHRVLHPRRRGYGSSSASPEGWAVVDEVRDALAVLDAADAPGAHVVGASWSALVVLDLAVVAPDRVRSLGLVEPPPLGGPTDVRFRELNAELLALRQRVGVPAALERFQTDLAGARWRAELEALLPGAVDRVERDAPTFFDRDVPALLSWRPDVGRLREVRAPALLVAGGASGPLFAGVSATVARWLPHVRTTVVDGAGHDVALTHPDDVASPLLRTWRPDEPPP